MGDTRHQFAVILILSSLNADAMIVDLSYPYDNQTMYPLSMSQKWQIWNDHRGPYKNITWLEYNHFCSSEHGGTHIDAPRHFIKNGWTIDQIPLERLINLPLVVIDIKQKTSVNPSAQLEVSDLLNWEAAHGEIPDRAAIMMNSGWTKYWGNVTAFLGGNTTDQLQFPSVSPDAAQWILDNRPKTYAFGVDTNSIEKEPSVEYLTHRRLLGHQIYIFEQVAYLDRVPAAGARITALPVKIKGGSGGPTRIAAFWDTATRSNVSGKQLHLILFIVLSNVVLSQFISMLLI